MGWNKTSDNRAVIKYELFVGRVNPFIIFNKCVFSSPEPKAQR